MVARKPYVRRVQSRELVTQVGALRWADVVSVERVGPDGVKCWLARSKLGDESRHLDCETFNLESFELEINSSFMI